MSASPRRRYPGLSFLVVFFTGFLFLVYRGLTAPGGATWESVAPLLGGGAMALLVGWLVVRERRDRADSGDEPTPPN